MRKGNKTSYRYDGLYRVERIFDSYGIPTDKMPSGKEEVTFFLERYSHIKKQSSSYTNKFSLQKLREYIENPNTLASINNIKVEEDYKQQKFKDVKICQHSEIVENINKGIYPVIAGVRVDNKKIDYFDHKKSMDYYANRFPENKTTALVLKWRNLYNIDEEDIKAASRLVVIKYGCCFYRATCLRKSVKKSGETMYSIRYDGSKSSSRVNIRYSEIHSVNNEQVKTEETK